MQDYVQVQGMDVVQHAASSSAVASVCMAEQHIALQAISAPTSVSLAIPSPTQTEEPPCDAMKEKDVNASLLVSRVAYNAGKTA